MVSSLRLKKFHWPTRRLVTRTGALQGGEVYRHGGLGETGTLVELAGADADLERVVLLDEVLLRFLQPAQRVASHRVGEP